MFAPNWKIRFLQQMMAMLIFGNIKLFLKGAQITFSTVILF